MGFTVLQIHPCLHVRYDVHVDAGQSIFSVATLLIVPSAIWHNLANSFNFDELGVFLNVKVNGDDFLISPLGPRQQPSGKYLIELKGENFRTKTLHIAGMS